MHGLRPEYQARINFVILDYDVREEFDFARQMGIANHPAYGVIPPDSGPEQIARRVFGPQSNTRLRELLEQAIAEYGN